LCQHNKARTTRQKTTQGEGSGLLEKQGREQAQHDNITEGSALANKGTTDQERKGSTDFGLETLPLTEVEQSMRGSSSADGG
jgi:hypothetical protein